MNLIQSVKTCFRKYAVFKGRATRSEFWWFQLFFWLVLICAGLLAWPSGLQVSEDGFDYVLLLEIALFIPVLTVTCRRLHDLGLTGWLQAPVILIYLRDLDTMLPGFGDIKIVEQTSIVGYLFFFLCLAICAWRGSAGKNKYGLDPKAPDMAEIFT
jgi:uncharacterized membrane protein YhaH (DUF805 family)